ncbi:hypothetical protein [Mesorhizobium retamae]|uniref:DUF4815 domain-containing protein n=1 Tax=Mesorhizobium retamae TaxID=2912854 RepID=A0ABS9QRA6_9HYPH|nr:hypothetical protein [Mesorhizobium sp. IRAMC:0171]MCG7509241.1 hypothetical protein [Mesorhizobium sp. IRAMC:0171]
MSDAFSTSEVLDLLKMGPSTFGWDVIVCYNRDVVNRIVFMDYINRYNIDSYIGDIEDVITISENEEWRYLYDYKLDAPILSFQDSAIETSRANLTMLVQGGVEISVRKDDGAAARRITSISYVDALAGPKLVAKLDLQTVSGDVSGAGEIYLDLSKGVDFEMLTSDDGVKNSRGGEFFKELFDRLPLQKKKYALSTYESISNQFVAPEKFVLRVHKARDARVRNSPRYGDGSVIQFVAMKGRPQGTLPARDADMPYLIPDGYSATILVGQHYLLRTLVKEGLRRFSNSSLAQVSFDNEQNLQAPVGNCKLDFVAIRAENPDIPISPSLRMRMDVSDFPFFGEPGWSMASVTYGKDGADDPIVFSMLASGFQHAATITLNGREHYVPIDFSTSSFTCRILNGKIEEHRLDPKFLEPFSNYPELRPYTIRLTAALVAFYRNLDESRSTALLSPLREIDRFRDACLLFRDAGSRFRVKESYLPLDLVMFGNAAPASEAFDVVPSEKIVSARADGTDTRFLQFNTVPERSDVNWSVRVVPGFDGMEAGSIDALGRYAPPLAAHISGLQTRVIVTAGTRDASSSALVFVVKGDIRANPLISVASLGGEKHALWIGAVDAAQIEWSKESDTGGQVVAGGLIDPVSGEEVGTHHYISGPSASPPGAFSIDRIVFRNKATGSECVLHMLVVHRQLGGEVLVDERVALPPDKIKLKFLKEGEEEEVVEWKIELGGGVINSDGIYTLDPSSDMSYALISGRSGVSGYIIIPIPLIDFGKTMSLYGY